MKIDRGLIGEIGVIIFILVADGIIVEFFCNESYFIWAFIAICALFLLYLGFTIRNSDKEVKKWGHEDKS